MLTIHTDDDCVAPPKGVDGVEASIPIEKALDCYGDVLLAYEMNGELLPPEHGGPLRIIVPGHVGIRNIKWVQAIVTSDEEAEGYWQRGAAYKGFAPGITSFDGIVRFLFGFFVFLFVFAFFLFLLFFFFLSCFSCASSSCSSTCGFQ